MRRLIFSTVILALGCSDNGQEMTPPSDLAPAFEVDPTRPPPGTVGSNCAADSDCGAGGKCLTAADGYPGGYCTVLGCSKGTCPTGTCYKLQDGSTMCLEDCKTASDCGKGYLCPDYGACAPGCGGTGCGPDELCGDDGLCSVKPCTATSCGPFTTCNSATGACEPDLATFPANAANPACDSGLPPRDCVGTTQYCGELIAYDRMGAGFDNYPINGETEADQYRSFIRRDLMMLSEWAAAYVDCKTRDWHTGNGMPIGLGDMSEASGAIPGTRDNDPGHPPGTHENGYDMDFAYFQIQPPDNHLREICPHVVNGSEQYHCVGEPDNIDLWKHSLLLGAMFTSPRVRVIGVDGRVGPLLDKSIPVLCQKGYLPQSACDAAAQSLAYEQVDMGYGWYLFHLHHSHISTTMVPNSYPKGGPAFADEAARARYGIRAFARRHLAQKLTD